ERSLTMSPFTIPSSSAVVTEASALSEPMPVDRFPLDHTPLPGRLEYLYPGALPVCTNAPVGQRFCWRCGQWRAETGFRSANDVCAHCRWAPYDRRHSTLRHHKETGHATVS